MASFTLKEIFDEFLRQYCVGFPKLTSEKMLEVNKALEDLREDRYKSQYKSKYIDSIDVVDRSIESMQEWLQEMQTLGANEITIDEGTYEIDAFDSKDKTLYEAVCDDTHRLTLFANKCLKYLEENRLEKIAKIKDQINDLQNELKVLEL